MFGYFKLSKIGKQERISNMNTVCQLCAYFAILPFGSDNMLISGCGVARLRHKSHRTSDMSVTVMRNSMEVKYECG